MTHDDMPEVLKECPFCGGEPSAWTDISQADDSDQSGVLCTSCGVEVSHEKDGAIAAWNTRRVTPPEVDLDKLREAFIITADTYAVDNLDKLEKWNEALRLIRQAAAAYLKERG